MLTEVWLYSTCYALHDTVVPLLVGGVHRDLGCQTPPPPEMMLKSGANQPMSEETGEHSSDSHLLGSLNMNKEANRRRESFKGEFVGSEEQFEQFPVTSPLQALMFLCKHPGSTTELPLSWSTPRTVANFCSSNLLCD